MEASKLEKMVFEGWVQRITKMNEDLSHIIEGVDILLEEGAGEVGVVIPRRSMILDKEENQAELRLIQSSLEQSRQSIESCRNLLVVGIIAKYKPKPNPHSNKMKALVSLLLLISFAFASCESHHYHTNATPALIQQEQLDARETAANLAEQRAFAQQQALVEQQEQAMMAETNRVYHNASYYDSPSRYMLDPYSEYNRIGSYAYHRPYQEERRYEVQNHLPADNIVKVAPASPSPRRFQKSTATTPPAYTIKTGTTPGKFTTTTTPSTTLQTSPQRFTVPTSSKPASVTAPPRTTTVYRPAPPMSVKSPVSAPRTQTYSAPRTYSTPSRSTSSASPSRSYSRPAYKSYKSK